VWLGLEAEIRPKPSTALAPTPSQSSPNRSASTPAPSLGRRPIYVQLHICTPKRTAVGGPRVDAEKLRHPGASLSEPKVGRIFGLDRTISENTSVRDGTDQGDATALVHSHRAIRPISSHRYGIDGLAHVPPCDRDNGTSRRSLGRRWRRRRRLGPHQCRGKDNRQNPTRLHTQRPKSPTGHRGDPIQLPDIRNPPPCPPPPIPLNRPCLA